MSCDLPAKPLRSAGSSRSTFWAALLYSLWQRKEFGKGKKHFLLCIAMNIMKDQGYAIFCKYVKKQTERELHRHTQSIG